MRQDNTNINLVVNGMDGDTTVVFGCNVIRVWELTIHPAKQFTRLPYKFISGFREVLCDCGLFDTVQFILRFPELAGMTRVKYLCRRPLRTT